MIDEVRTAEERLDADQRALERKTEMLENAWRADWMALDRERQTLAVQRQEHERRSIDLARWESALATERLNLYDEQASFRQQRVEAEQEQRPRLLRMLELIWAANEHELLSILNTVRYRLNTRASSTYAPEQITRTDGLP
jgi:G3E family GTPase